MRIVRDRDIGRLGGGGGDSLPADHGYVLRAAVEYNTPHCERLVLVFTYPHSLSDVLPHGGGKPGELTFL